MQNAVQIVGVAVMTQSRHAGDDKAYLDKGIALCQRNSHLSFPNHHHLLPSSSYLKRRFSLSPLVDSV
jgi:hypothetical protein